MQDQLLLLLLLTKLCQGQGSTTCRVGSLTPTRTHTTITTTRQPQRLLRRLWQQQHRSLLRWRQRRQQQQQLRLGAGVDVEEAAGGLRLSLWLLDCAAAYPVICGDLAVWLVCI
jgi:hypothetical protein